MEKAESKATFTIRKGDEVEVKIGKKKYVGIITKYFSNAQIQIETLKTNLMKEISKDQIIAVH